MGLDAYVRCRCIQDGQAKPHPFPEKLTLDEIGEAALTGNPSDQEWIAHDRWFDESCEHRGYLVSERLGNVTAVTHLRRFIRALQADPGPRFPVLLAKVVYDGTHSGDWIPSDKAAELLAEVNTIVHSGDILSVPEKEFFASMKRLCEASIKTGNPIVF